MKESLAIALESFDEEINAIALMSSDCGSCKNERIYKQVDAWINLVDCYFLEVGAVATWEDFVTKAEEKNKIQLINTLIIEAKNILKQVF